MNTWVGNGDYIGDVLIEGLALPGIGRGGELVAGDCHRNVPKLACMKQSGAQTHKVGQCRAHRDYACGRLLSDCVYIHNIHSTTHSAAKW